MRTVMAISTQSLSTVDAFDLCNVPESWSPVRFSLTDDQPEFSPAYQEIGHGPTGGTPPIPSICHHG